jgi:hypothetical protein
MERAFTAEDSAHLARIKELVGEAEQHHRAGVDAAAKGDMKALAQHQIRCSRSFRSLHVRFAKWAGDAVQADIDANQQIQTSSGTGGAEGSANGRGSPLYHAGNAGIAGWLQRAREGGRRS